MVLQPSTEQNADLPSLAQSDGRTFDRNPPARRQLTEPESADRFARAQPAPVATEPKSPAAEPPAATPAPSSAPRDLAVSDQASSSTPNMPAAATDRLSDANRLDTIAPSSTGEAKPAAAAAPAYAASPPASPALDQPLAETADDHRELVIVQLLAKPNALEKKAFDALLVKNQVDVEGSSDRSEAKSDLGAATNATSAIAEHVKQPAHAATAGNAEPADEIHSRESEMQPANNVQLVLVEASPHTILSCMNELSSDTENYPGIAVDTPVANGKAPAGSLTALNKQAAELRKFNRGVVPPLPATALGDGAFYETFGLEDSEQLARRRYFNSRGAFGGEIAKRRASGGQLSSRDAFAYRIEPQTTSGKNERAQSSSDTLDFDADSAADAKPLSEPSVDKRAPSAQPAAADRMRVLFVIRPADAATPSLKAKNSPQ
jgi:hypothetical protein